MLGGGAVQSSGPEGAEQGQRARVESQGPLRGSQGSNSGGPAGHCRGQGGEGRRPARPACVYACTSALCGEMSARARSLSVFCSTPYRHIQQRRVMECSRLPAVTQIHAAITWLGSVVGGLYM